MKKPGSDPGLDHCVRTPAAAFVPIEGSQPACLAR